MLLPATFALLLSGRIATAQVYGGPVRQDSGPIRELSTNVGDGSGPVRERAGGLRDANAGRLSGNSVRGSVTGDLVSGPVSDISLGPVTSGRPSSGGGTVTDVSAGAVTKDIDSPIRAGIAAPVRGLGPLQERLRAIEPLPREETMSEEAAQASADLPDAEPDIGDAAPSQFVTPPQPQVSGEVEPGAEQGDQGVHELDEQPDAPEAE
jgi:hypothetical protein